jgi:hypothetical protein
MAIPQAKDYRFFATVKMPADRREASRAPNPARIR